MNYEDRLKIQTQLKKRINQDDVFPTTTVRHIFINSGDTTKKLTGATLNSIGGVTKGMDLLSSYVSLQDLLYDMFYVEGVGNNGGSGIYWEGVSLTSEDEINF